MGIRGNQHLGGAAAGQIGFQCIGIGRIVIYEQNTLALMAQAFHHGNNRRLLFLYPGDPAEADSECDEVGAHSGFGLRSDPPRRPVLTAMTLGIGGS